METRPMRSFSLGLAADIEIDPSGANRCCVIGTLSRSILILERAGKAIDLRATSSPSSESKITNVSTVPSPVFVRVTCDMKWSFVMYRGATKVTLSAECAISEENEVRQSKKSVQ